MNLEDEYKQQLIVRLEAKKNIDHDTDCWLWQGTKTPKGYGVTKVHGKSKKVHRISYEIYVKPIKEGAVIHHKCSNTSCYNPEHLQQVSHIQNTAEMSQRQWYLNRIKELEEEIKLLKS